MHEDRKLAQNENKTAPAETTTPPRFSRYRDVEMKRALEIGRGHLHLRLRFGPHKSKPNNTEKLHCDLCSTMVSFSTQLIFLLGATATAVSAFDVVSLTPDNYEAETSGKTVFIKFFAPCKCIQRQ